MKNRVKRLGVMGGGFFTLRLPIVEAGGGDDEGISANEERRPLKEGDGDDIGTQGENVAKTID